MGVGWTLLPWDTQGLKLFYSSPNNFGYDLSDYRDSPNLIFQKSLTTGSIMVSKLDLNSVGVILIY